jgi:hypothetical protein
MMCAGHSSPPPALNGVKQLEAEETVRLPAVAAEIMAAFDVKPGEMYGKPEIGMVYCLPWPAGVE